MTAVSHARRRDDREVVAPALAAAPAGLPWILPALVVSVGILYYCIVYTGYISTLDWDGTSPLQEFVGGRELRADAAATRSSGALSATRWCSSSSRSCVQVVLGIVFACLLHSKLYLRTSTRC